MLAVEKMMYAVFAPFGRVASLRVLEPLPESVAMKALLRFETMEQALAAKEALHGTSLHEVQQVPLVVKYAEKGPGNVKLEGPSPNLFVTPTCRSPAHT